MTLQVEGCYDAISMPLLADVHLDYLGGLVGMFAGPFALTTLAAQSACWLAECSRESRS